MPTLADLLTPRNAEEVKSSLIDVLREQGFPTTSWAEDSVPRGMLEADATAYADGEQLVARIAEGGLGARATGSWLTIRARNFYAIDREPALVARGKCVLTATAEAGPYSILPGQLWARSSSGRRYTNTEGGELAQGSTLTLEFRAESPGSEHNTGVGSITTLVTPLPGVSISNPEIGSTGTWQTTLGTDEESDESLYRRTQNRWAELGPGATSATYENWARQSDPQIRRVRVVSGAADDGTVEILVAGDAGGVGTDVVSAAQAYIDERTPLTVQAVVESAVNKQIMVEATIYVDPQWTAPALAEGVAAVETYIRSVPLGGTVYRSQILGALTRPQGVRNVVVTSPAADVALDPNEVALPETSGVTVEAI